MRRMVAVASALALAASVASCGGGGGEAEEGGDEARKETGETGAKATAGDPKRGKELYLNLGCGSCHTYSAAGSKRNVGPNLDEVAKKYDAAFIRESIVNPDAFIEKGEAGSIGGTRRYSARMPAYGPDEDYPQELSEQELADLVAFLTQPGN